MTQTINKSEGWRLHSISLLISQIGISKENTQIKDEMKSAETTNGAREEVTIADNEDKLTVTDSTASTQLEKETEENEFQTNDTTTNGVTGTRFSLAYLVR